MGISVTEYRITIGIHNNCKVVTCACIDIQNFLLVTVIYELLITFIIPLLLFLSGDIELNPGPASSVHKELNICHSNVRGLRENLVQLKLLYLKILTS